MKDIIRGAIDKELQDCLSVIWQKVTEDDATHLGGYVSGWEHKPVKKKATKKKVAKKKVAKKR